MNDPALQSQEESPATEAVKQQPASSGFGFDWRVVRGLGQLQLLNRTSMMLVIFVPILAAAWPSVRKGLEWANGVSYALPTTWALLFLASLAVLIARTIFQLRCPEIVKDLSFSDYVRSRKREYTEAPSVSAVQEAILHLLEMKLGTELITQEIDAEAAIESQAAELERRKASIDGDIQTAKARKQSTATPGVSAPSIDEDIRNLTYEARDLNDQLNRLKERDRGDRGPDFRRKMALIELGARYRYIDEAKKARFAMAVCALSYACAIGLIIKVLADQTATVLNAVGWTGSGW